MKKVLLILLILNCSLLIVNCCNAQELWGMTNLGGATNNGVIFEYNGSTYNHWNFTGSSGNQLGSQPAGSLVLAHDSLYGMTEFGGIHGGFYYGGQGDGVLFKFNPNNLTNTYDTLMCFDSTKTGSHPMGSLILVGDSNLYGMTSDGGADGYGTIFKYNLFTKTFTKLWDFDYLTNGANPIGSLMQASDGNLYGMTSAGAYFEIGNLFKITHEGNFYDLRDFVSYWTNANEGPAGSLIQATDKNLYGMNYNDGANKLGTIFEYNFITSTYTDLLDFNGTNGEYPFGSLIQACDSNLYGMTYGDNQGNIFKYNLNTMTYTDIFDFNSTDGNGRAPLGSLMQASNGNLYGMTSANGTTISGFDGYGILFEYNPVSKTFTKKFEFTGANGNYPGSQPYYTALTEVCSNIPTITGDSIVCTGSTGNVYTTASGMSNYTWTVTGGTITAGGGTTDNTLTVTWNTSGQQTVSVLYERNCSLCGSATSPIVYPVKVKPSPIISHQPASEAVCFPDSAKFSIKANGSGLSYQWYGPVVVSLYPPWIKNEAISGATDTVYNIHTTAPFCNGYYCCTITNASGCIATSNAVLLTVKSRPTVSVSAVPPSVCPGYGRAVSSTLTASGANNYLWSPTTSLNTTTGSTVTANPTVTTTYTVTGTDEHSCTNTAKVTVYVNTPVIVDATNLIEVRNLHDSISFHITPGGGLCSYQWKLNGINISGATDSKYSKSYITCADSGLYFCRVSNACDTVIAKKIRLFVNCTRYQHSISGYVKYDNADSNALCKSTTVYLLNSSNTIIDSIATDTNGYYVFANLINGAYKLTCKTTIPWGGVNPVDALLIDRTYVHLSKITDPLRRLAGDVNNDGQLRPTDGLLIDRRWARVIKKFSIPDWLFSDPTVTLNNVDITNENIMAICAGDANGSYIFPSRYVCNINTSHTIIPNNKSHIFNPQMLANMCKIIIDSIVAKPLDTVDLPVRVQRFTPISAFAFRIRYNTNNIKFLKITNLNPAIPDSTLISYAFRDSINIVWLQPLSDTNSLRLANAKLFDLQFVYKSGTDTLSFTPDCVVADDSLNEINVIYQNGNIGPLYINTQPQNSTKCLGDSASFSIAAIGTGTDTLSYRWLKLIAGSWVIEAGDTNSKFKIQNLELSDSGTYRCIIFSAYGRVTSDSVTLVVNTPVAITYSSPDTTTCSVPVTLNCFATGTGLSYQWYSSEGAVGYGNDTLITSAADNYYCIISGACGDTIAYITLTVNTPPDITQQSSDTAVCAGSAATLSVTATGTSPLSYQWDKLEIGSWQQVSTNSQFYILHSLLADSGSYMSVVSNVCGNDTSYSVFLTLDTLPVITQQPSGGDMFEGDDFTFSLTATGPSLLYQWYKNSSTISGATNSAYSIQDLLSSDAGKYVCLVNDTCGAVTSDTAILTVYACHRCIHPRQIDNNQTGKTVGNTIDPEVNLYPNPNDGSFTLELKLPSDGNVTLEAYNILGELVKSSVFQFQSPLSIIHYQLSIAKGIYFLNIITPTKTFNRKVIIE